VNLTVKQCASSLNVSVQDVLSAARKNSIFVNTEDDLLTFQQVAMIEGALKAARGGPPGTNEDREAAAKNMLEHFVSSYKIFMDTSSLLSPYADKFFANLVPLLTKYNANIVIPKRVIDELYKHQANTTNPDLAKKAYRALKNIQTLLQNRQVDVRGEESDNFADNVFQVVFTKFRINNKLLLITEDNGLAQDIMALNNNQSVRGKSVSAKRLSKYGYLAAYSWESAQPKTVRPVVKSSAPTPHSFPAFKVCAGMMPEKDALLNVSSIPGANDQVYVFTNDWQLVRLGEKIASGGEGTIYRTNSNYVAKIYKKEHITRLKQEKIRKMLEFKLQCNGICFPVAAVYNTQKQFVGYLMPIAQGKELQRSVFIKPIFLKTFPNWKRRDTVELCITILEKIKYLHDRNIMMGDINPANVLVVSPKEVHFVDTDSYQIETLPCPVGTINFTAPEIQGKRYSDFLRTVGNENFAVATLLFMIMLPGKAPYAQQGGGDPIANIKGMNFSYPLGDQGSKQTPDGPWRFIWSHLTYDIKKAFYNTFRDGGENSTEQTRLGVDEWLKLFRYYLRLLDEGKLREQDPMSEELFPTRHKLNPNVTYIKCRLCGEQVNEKSAREGICRSCMDDGEVVRCKRCGKEFIFTNYQKYVKKQSKFETCKECADWYSAPAPAITCTDCGRSFTMTNGEVEFFTSKGMSVPKRCKTCRQKAKSGGAAPSAYRPTTATRPTSTYTPPRPQTPPKPKAPAPAPKKDDKGGFCFITTAVCEYMGKADDCIELKTLRKFRDEWLAFQSGGQELIERYYEIAPGIVEKIKDSPFYEYYCESLWKEYLSPCLEMISLGDYEACKNHYTDMVERFSSLLT